MLIAKKLLLVIAGAVFYPFCLGQEIALTHPRHSPFVADEIAPLSEAGNQNVLIVDPEASNRPAYYSAGTSNIILATKEETGGVLSAIDIVSLSGFGAPPHIHTQEHEVFYVLEGEVNFQLGSPTGIQNIVATPGTFAFLPKGRPHAWFNIGDTPARLVVFPLPGGFEGFIIDQNEPVIDRTAPIPASPPPANIGEIAQRYGIQLPSPSDFEESDSYLDHLLIPPGSVNRPSYTEAGAVFTSLATRQETGGQASVFDIALALEGGTTQLSSSENESTVFYVLDGDVAFQIEDETLMGTAGTFVYLPEDTSYAFQNGGTTAARMLLLQTSLSVPEPTTTVSLLLWGAVVATACALNQKEH